MTPVAAASLPIGRRPDEAGEGRVIASSRSSGLKGGRRRTEKDHRPSPMRTMAAPKAAIVEAPVRAMPKALAAAPRA